MHSNCSSARCTPPAGSLPPLALPQVGGRQAPEALQIHLRFQVALNYDLNFEICATCRFTAAPGADPKLVAVKRLKPELFDDPAQHDMFIKEVALMRKLKHK